MKKFLLSVVVALMSAVMWNGVNARLVQGKRIPASLIKAGDTIALEGRFKGWFLGVGTRGISLEISSEGYNETS